MRLNRDLAKIKSRKIDDDEAVQKSVREILADVKVNGDAAVRKYAAKFDGFVSENMLVAQDEISAAIRNTGDDFTRILKRTIEQIKDFHVNQIEKSWGIF